MLPAFKKIFLILSWDDICGFAVLLTAGEGDHNEIPKGGCAPHEIREKVLE
jgi:hypothetical protein